MHTWLSITFSTLSYGFFSAWIVLTVVNQFDGRFPAFIRSFDRFRLLPRWTFFAPRPGMTDYHIVFRDIDGDGKPCTEWTEVVLPHRGLSGAFWNPAKRQRKVLADYVRSLATLAKMYGAEEMSLSVPYIACLQFTLNYQVPSPAANARQFGIASTKGCANNSVGFVFRSVSHPLA